jgi:2-keto-4-pentenoate hydratase/2-oxohepta-3-ene-1,7-dioic acid hydratase in catechol pathway
MRFLTFADESGLPALGVLRGGKILDLNKWLGDTNPVRWTMLTLIAASAEQPQVYGGIIERLHAVFDDELNSKGLLKPMDKATLYAPIPFPRCNVICLGHNYSDHAAESKLARGEQVQVDRPDYPNFFTKSAGSINGPYSDIPFDPEVSTQIDWEGELAFVIGKQGKNIPLDKAMDHVFGYTIVNDVTARDLQRRYAGQFFKGKSVDGSCPMGPWLVTADEIPNVHNLDIEVRVNGEVKQHGNTGAMLFTIPEIIQELSVGMTLQPGDIISTGTPSGVGFARNPPQFLKPGDVVECSITSLGTLRNHVKEVHERHTIIR